MPPRVPTRKAPQRTAARLRARTQRRMPSGYGGFWRRAGSRCGVWRIPASSGAEPYAHQWGWQLSGVIGWWSPLSASFWCNCAFGQWLGSYARFFAICRPSIAIWGATGDGTKSPTCMASGSSVRGGLGQREQRNGPPIMSNNRWEAEVTAGILSTSSWQTA